MEKETNVTAVKEQTKSESVKYSNEEIDKFVEELNITKMTEILYSVISNIEKYYNAQTKLAELIEENDNNAALTAIMAKLGQCDERLGMSADEYFRMQNIINEFNDLNAFKSAKDSVKYWLKYFNRLNK